MVLIVVFTVFWTVVLADRCVYCVLDGGAS